MLPKLAASILGSVASLLVASCLVTAPSDDELVGSCADGVRNGDEVDVDCGAECGLCVAGKKCTVNESCGSNLCDQGVCREASCTDGAQNGTESDRDCGGGCPPCGMGAICKADGDCITGTCIGARCTAPSCTDGVKNGGEADVDCGSIPDCPYCPNGKACTIDDDCDSYVCLALVCVASACEDEVQNGEESDTDCGGSFCGPCALGQNCFEDTDCVTSNCDTNDFVCE